MTNIHPSIRWIKRATSGGVRRHEHEAYYSPPPPLVKVLEYAEFYFDDPYTNPEYGA
jgi:hypothetical protein